MIETSLPVVKPETCFSIERECLGVRDVEFIKKTLKKIMKNNPVVAMWIKNYSKTTKDRFGAIVCAVVVYRLLESQDEADFLNLRISPLQSHI
jgi:hypothetical protein